MKKKIIIILAILVNLFIWTNSLMPGSISSSQSGFIGNFLYPPFKNLIEYDNFITIIRKMAHFTEFMVLGFLLTFVYRNKKLSKFDLIAMIHAFLVACIDEIIQLFIPGRAGMVGDVLIDSLGAITGVIIALIIIKLVIKNPI